MTYNHWMMPSAFSVIMLTVSFDSVKFVLIVASLRERENLNLYHES